ncbi:MAG TPA: glycosyltransferase family 9 protein [Chthoniobacterales bacterium]|nr:glycosyltransferase family 9 protein [Chthoniobacterales bacterium]
MNRILVIRGGAIGDFILTLPALKALRDAHPCAHIEILGYKHIAALAENRFYAQTVRSIEYGPLSSFFTKDSELPAELVSYFASFDLIISYLFDPDGIFETNLRRCGARRILNGPAKPARVDEPGGESINTKHAARQLARPIEELGLGVEDFSAKLYPSSEDRHFAEKLLGNLHPPSPSSPRDESVRLADRTGIVAFHPGSGSESKNWPTQNWIDLGNRLLASGDFHGSIVIVSGEADEDQIRQLEPIWGNARVAFAKNLPLPHLAAVLEHTIFIGHDSGISHLAAAAGANCILLFGPSDPAIWAPIGENVRVLRVPNGDLCRLDVDLVQDALDQELMRIGIST